MAPASCKTMIAQPRSVRNAGRLRSVANIGMIPSRWESNGGGYVPLLSADQRFQIAVAVMVAVKVGQAQASGTQMIQRAGLARVKRD